MVIKVSIAGMLMFAIGIWLLYTIKVPYTHTATFIENVPLNYSIPQEAKIIEVSTWWGLSHDYQAQALVENDDSATGMFTINFIFNDGTQTTTKIVNQQISPSEIKLITSDVPLKGNVTVQTKVTPGTKQVSVQKEVTEQVSLSDFYFKGLNH